MVESDCLENEKNNFTVLVEMDKAFTMTEANYCVLLLDWLIFKTDNSVSNELLDMTFAELRTGHLFSALSIGIERANQWRRGTNH